MTERGALDAVSPLDGRYARYTEPLVPYASERALMCARVQVEVEYLIALADLDATPLAIDADQREHLRGLYESFDTDDASVVKQLETEGYGEYTATNHDVKAVEYFVRLNLPEDLDAGNWIHFGLTSEDVNNLAHRLLVEPAVEDVLVPELRDVRDALAEMARQYRDVLMLARTHGQPATPTTFGKEMAVYASRLGRALARIERAAGEASGKLAGASGTYAAHHAAYPDVDWPAFSREFVGDLGLNHEPLTTQVNPATTSPHSSTRSAGRTTSCWTWIWTSGSTSPTATSARRPSRARPGRRRCPPQGQSDRLREQRGEPLEGELRP